MKAIFYARVSRTDLHTENQEKILKEWAERHNAEIEKSLFLTEEMSTRKTRPIKQNAITLFRRGECQATELQAFFSQDLKFQLYLGMPPLLGQDC